MLNPTRNQVNRECLYAWYPEVNSQIVEVLAEPRDIYIHTGIDRTLLTTPSEVRRVTNNMDDKITDGNGSSSTDHIYHTAETIDEALRTPWALDYEVKRRPATPNIPSQKSEIPKDASMARRLKSAPVQRTILTIPEPRFLLTEVPTTAVNAPVRVSSAKARSSSTVVNEKTIHQREVKSAQGTRRVTDSKLSPEELEQIFKRVYGDSVATQETKPTVEIIYKTPAPPSAAPAPIQIYKRSNSWTNGESTAVPMPTSSKEIEITAIPLNPYYIHRPGVIAIRNVEKKSVIRSPSASKVHRRSHGKRAEPLRALPPSTSKPKLSLEIDGVKLTYDPILSLDDRSPNLTKYFIDGRLYLIKDKRYNIFKNIDPSTVEKYNRRLTNTQRSRSKPSSSQGNTSTQRRYVVYDDLNINKMSLSNRTSNEHVYTSN